MESLITLETTLGREHGSRLRSVIKKKITSLSLLGLEDSERALRFVKGNLRGSYLFARFIVPSYSAAVFASLTNLPPVDDSIGPVIASIKDVVRGELTNNNIFERSGECHSHYYDALEAYKVANLGDITEVESFHLMEREKGIDYAILNSSFWSDRSRDYAHALIACCKQPLATFIMMSVNEEMAPAIYQKALESFSLDLRFNKFRQFMERHVQFDKDAHGPDTLKWLAYFLEAASVTVEEIQTATDTVLRGLNL